MRVWIDITNSPHVPFFRPLVHLLRERGAEVSITSREYAQTLQLLAAAELDAQVIGAHGGRSAAGKAQALVSRLPALIRFGRAGRFDIALTHGSHELMLAARTLGIPGTTAFDYEYAWLQHQLGCRAARSVVVPAAIPPERLAPYGVRAGSGKLARYEGLKEEYYLAGFEPDPAVPAALGIDPARVVVVVRTPPDVSLYHRHGNPLFPRVLERLGSDPAVQAVVLPRTDEQRAAIRALGLPSLIVPERAVDAQSLIAVADLVVSAGGTMNREAVALGAPVVSLFGGRLGGVDEALIREGRLRPLVSAAALELRKRATGAGVAERVRRDPAVMLELLLSPLRCGGGRDDLMARR